MWYTVIEKSYYKHTHGALQHCISGLVSQSEATGCSRASVCVCVWSSACIHQACQDSGADWGSATRCPCSLMAVPSITVRAERNLAVKLETTDPQNWGQ